ncbi:MAG: AraC family transcriptional regulator [Candidatus Pseudobacter hemicellulosilyticus]|uniref:AraC family transcriptional regulator n=1 Tax=Candidatus Pseudobacter hemicellulosilyticus TaxID=3121375 RepID=A0AAJ5WXG7_9BACT|nr:MAG: AraC family transcriptional regulator [Pseudobacter sp.]
MNFLSQVKPERVPDFSADHLLWETAVTEEHNIESIIEQQDRSALFQAAGKEAVIRQLSTSGLVALDTRLLTTENMDWLLTVEKDCILMEFVLSGDIYPGTGPHDKLKNADGLHQLQYVRHLSRICRLSSDTLLDAFCILLSKDFYFTLIGKTNKIHDDFAKHIRAGRNTGLAAKPLPMNHDMRRIIEELRTCTRKGSFQRLCLEIKVLELILLQLEQFHYQFVEVTPRQSLHEDDIKKIRSARFILDDAYNDPPTIRRLSQLVGVNEIKLKKGFKEIFNSTIHSYVLKIRMEKANQLVKEQSLQMKEVALELGYKNPSHFSAAFKKHFGFLPTEMVG